MWTVDSRCSSCGNKETCADRKVIVSGLGALSNTLNTSEEHLASPGDGILIMACNDFTAQ